MTTQKPVLHRDCTHNIPTAVADAISTAPRIEGGGVIPRRDYRQTGYLMPE